MTKQEGTGWAIVLVILFILLWLLKQMGTGQTAVVQSGIALPGGQMNAPTTTQYGGCC